MPIEDDDVMLCRKWPLEPRSDLKFDEFRAKLTNVKGFGASSVSTYVQKLEHIYGLIHIDGEGDGILHIGDFAGLHTTGVMAEVLNLAVVQFVEYMTLTCGQRKYKGAGRILTQLKMECLEPEFL